MYYDYNMYLYYDYNTYLHTRVNLYILATNKCLEYITRCLEVPRFVHEHLILCMLAFLPFMRLLAWYGQAQLMEAGRVLGVDVKQTKEDETAVLTGERSTARTGEALKIDHNAAMKNTASAMGVLKKIHKDEQLYYQDASQAR